MKTLYRRMFFGLEFWIYSKEPGAVLRASALGPEKAPYTEWLMATGTEG